MAEKVKAIWVKNMLGHLKIVVQTTKILKISDKNLILR